MASELDAELRAIRDLVRRIRPPLAHYPEAFHTDKDDVAVRLGQLLERLTALPAATVLTAPPVARRPSGREVIRQAQITVTDDLGRARQVRVERRRRA